MTSSVTERNPRSGGAAMRVKICNEKMKLKLSFIKSVWDFYKIIKCVCVCVFLPGVINFGVFFYWRGFCERVILRLCGNGGEMGFYVCT